MKNIICTKVPQYIPKNQYEMIGSFYNVIKFTNKILKVAKYITHPKVFLKFIYLAALGLSCGMWDLVP